MSSFAGVPCVIYGFSNASGGLRSGGSAGVCASGFGNWSYSKTFYGFYPSGSPNISKSSCPQGHVGSNPTRSAMSEQTSYRLLRLFYKSQSALTPLLLLSKPNPLSLGFGLGPPLRGGFVLLQENIGRNQPFHIVFSPSEYIPSVDEHKSSGAGTIKCRTARNRWEGVRFSWTVSHTDVSLKGVVPDGRKKQAYPACAHCQERMK